MSLSDLDCHPAQVITHVAHIHVTKFEFWHRFTSLSLNLPQCGDTFYCCAMICIGVAGRPRVLIRPLGVLYSGKSNTFSVHTGIPARAFVHTIVRVQGYPSCCLTSQSANSNIPLYVSDCGATSSLCAVECTLGRLIVCTRYFTSNGPSPYTYDL